MGWFLFISVLIVVFLVNGGMKMMHFSDDKAKAYFEDRGFDGQIEKIRINDIDVKVISSKPNAENQTLIVFVHGAPGSWDAFKQFITDKDISRGATVIAYDRPGYGGSSLLPMSGIQDQAEILKEIIRTYKTEKVILVGHSYGGPIAGLAALDEKMEVDATIMIAPLVDPESEPIFWYSYFSYWKWSRWMLPPSLIVAGSEKFAHSNELAQIDSLWKKAESRFIHVHGLEDGLAPGKENISFTKANIPEQKLTQIVYEKKGHLVIWTDFELMKAIIMDEKDRKIGLVE